MHPDSSTWPGGYQVEIHKYGGIAHTIMIGLFEAPINTTTLQKTMPYGLSLSHTTSDSLSKL